MCHTAVEQGTKGEEKRKNLLQEAFSQFVWVNVGR